MNLLFIIFITLMLFVSGFLFWQKYYKSFIGITIFTTVSLIYERYYYNLEKDIITVAISPDYMPYAYMHKDQIKGIDVDLLREVVEKGMKKKLVLKPVGWNFLMHTEGDIIGGGLSVTENREAKLPNNLCFSASYAPSTTGIITRPGLQLNHEFAGTILVQSGSVFVEIAKHRFPNAKILLRDDFNLAVEELNNCKADCLMGDALVLLYIFDNNIGEKYVIYKVKHKINNNTAKYTAFIINKKTIDPEQFNTLLLMVKQKVHTNEYQKLIKKLLALKTI